MRGGRSEGNGEETNSLQCMFGLINITDCISQVTNRCMLEKG
jgi:hypothetical protein